MAADARREAIEAMVAALPRCSCHSAHVAADRIDPRCGHHASLGDLPSLLDAIPTEVGTRLFAIDRQGMESVGWGGCTVRSDCDDDGHEWDLVHEDGTGQLDPDHPTWPVYRLTERPGVPTGEDKHHG